MLSPSFILTVGEWVEEGEWRSSLTSLLRPLEVNCNGMEDEVCVSITPLPLYLFLHVQLSDEDNGEGRGGCSSPSSLLHIVFVLKGE